MKLTLKSLINLKDARIINILTTNNYIPGFCDTCDYGAVYVQEILFEFDDDRVIKLKIDGKLSCFVSVENIIRFLNNSLDELSKMVYKEFKEYITERLNNEKCLTDIHYNRI